MNTVRVRPGNNQIGRRFNFDYKLNLRLKIIGFYINEVGLFFIKGIEPGLFGVYSPVSVSGPFPVFGYHLAYIVIVDSTGLIDSSIGSLVEQKIDSAVAHFGFGCEV